MKGRKAKQMKNEMYTISEIAEFFKFSTGSAYRLIYNEAIPFIKIGGRILVWSEALEEWIKKQQEKWNRWWH